MPSHRIYSNHRYWLTSGILPLLLTHTCAVFRYQVTGSTWTATHIATSSSSMSCYIPDTRCAACLKSITPTTVVSAPTACCWAKTTHCPRFIEWRVTGGCMWPLGHTHRGEVHSHLPPRSYVFMLSLAHTHIRTLMDSHSGAVRGHLLNE